MIELGTGWLAPNGDFIPCAVYQHLDCARNILATMNVKSTNKPDQQLHDVGYAEISISQLGVREWRIYWKNFLTEQQKNFLKPYFEDPFLPVGGMARMYWDKENDLI